MSGRESTKKNKNVPKAPLLKILMIHGYRQNEMAFRERSGGLRKALKSHAEFIFCEAPHIIPAKVDSSEAVANESSNDQRGWWFSTDNQTYSAHDFTSVQNKFEETLDYLNKVFETQGPFDGILGFSQGACLASILARMSEENVKNSESLKYKFIKFDFSIIVAGYKSRQSQHDVYYDAENKVVMPTFHVFGNGDQVIPRDMSNSLSEYFSQPKIFVHELGHFIPVNADSKAAFIEFLEKMKKNA